MEHTWDVEETNGVSLVSCQLHNDEAVTRRVTVRSRLDGPVFPPRRRGRPEPGWTNDGITVRLDSGAHRPIGFAAAAEPVEPPIELVVDPEPCDPIGTETDETTTARVNESPPTAVGDADAPETRALHALGTHRPPRDALATETGIPETDDERLSACNAGSIGGRDKSEATGDTGSDTTARVDALDRPGGTEPPERESAEREPVEGDSAEQDPPERAPAGQDPPERARSTVDDWFEAVERRIDRGERMGDADVATATEIIAAAGGVEPITVLDDQLDADVEHLRYISERATELAARAEATTIPTDALRTLA